MAAAEEADDVPSWVFGTAASPETEAAVAFVVLVITVLSPPVVAGTGTATRTDGRCS